MKFNSCVRHDHVVDTECHTCFFCGLLANLKYVGYCDDCGQWKCPSCGKCYCLANEDERRTLYAVYQKYCCNLRNLLEFDEVLDISGSSIIIGNATKALTYCSSKLYRLNLGCGTNLMKNYTNVDIQDITPGPIPTVKFVRADCHNLSFLMDNSVDEIYLSQLIEHIHPLDIKEYLYEWRRVLKVGGVLKVVFPDFEKVVEGFERCKTLKTTTETMEFLTLNFVVLNTVQRADSIRSTYPHRSLITVNFLTILLTSEGFGILDIDRMCQKERYSTEIIAIKE